MKTKIILGSVVIAQLSVGMCIASAQAISRSKPPLPPLPPGLVVAQDGKIKEGPSGRTARKSTFKKEAVVAESPAPGSKINEPAGAALADKEAAKVEIPK